jgi:hypothetical protein
LKTALRFLLIVLCCSPALRSQAQQIDSIYFNLYTDSLKKGTHNYINVDGKLANGRYLPLDKRHIILTASDGKLEGNSLWLEPDFKPASVTLKAVLKSNPAISKVVTIWIKTTESNEKLKTTEEILREMEQQAPASKKKKRRKGG